MPENNYALPPCDGCGRPLARRYHTFDRNVERYDYPSLDEITGIRVTVTVLHSEAIGMYCRGGCALAGAVNWLAAHGIRLTYPGEGPMEVCAVCGALLDMTAPHVAYQTMDQTEFDSVEGHYIQPHDSETLAVVCPRCDGDLPAEGCEAEQNEQHDELLALTVPCATLDGQT